ncbi:MAG: hypothetical protein SGJ27_22805 [Candidatus Melainabacteria bacterium]|nr:hypothetical protein [Candidatus Melainabacteria bacterium]
MTTAKDNWIRAGVITSSTLAFLLLVNCAVKANPTPIGSPGTTLIPFAPKVLKDISITEETLLIEDGKTDTIPSVAPGGGRMSVPCVRYQAQYQFENKTGNAKSVKVGFPIIVYSQVAGGSYGGLSDLKAVYGKKNLVVKESSASKPMIFPKEMLSEIIGDLKAAKVVRPVAESSDFLDLSRLGATWKSANAVLAKSDVLSKKQLLNCQKVLKRIAYSGSDETLVGQTLVWYNFEVPLPQGLSEKLTVSYNSLVLLGDDYSFSYILNTARFWNNEMRHLKIEIEPDRKFEKNGGKYQILPAEKFSRDPSSGRYVFKSKNEVPKFDIFIKRIP